MQEQIIPFDFDNFKMVNDNYGHLAGDKVLVDCINLVRDCICNTTLLARWGGEEFVMLLSDTKKDAAAELAEKLNVLISDYNFHPVGHITCSFGVASLNEQDNMDSLLNKVDQQLYLAKRNGKNKVSSL